MKHPNKNLSLLAVAAAGDLARTPSFAARPFVVKLGEWSFALYLTHLLIERLIERVAGDALPSSGPGA